MMTCSGVAQVVIDGHTVKVDEKKPLYMTRPSNRGGRFDGGRFGGRFDGGRGMGRGYEGGRGGRGPSGGRGAPPPPPSPPSPHT